MLGRIRGEESESRFPAAVVAVLHCGTGPAAWAGRQRNRQRQAGRQAKRRTAARNELSYFFSSLLQSVTRSAAIGLGPRMAGESSQVQTPHVRVPVSASSRS